jgi:predicted CXXCH cytochrome family protein
MGLGPKTVAASIALACVLVLAAPLTAAAEVPHVATSLTTDTCAMCHRAHSGPGDFGRIDPDSWEMTSTALALAVPLDVGDAALCYVCHGVDALGSGTPVGASFAETSTHTLAPVPSPFGPSVKYCSSCHDSHGADKIATDTPYPALLRARTEVGTAVFQGSEYCGTCHQERAESRFDGVAVYEQTTHFTMLPDPDNGTEVRCTICHESHGSAIAPLVTGLITPPAAPATATITANDRTLCFACHADPRGTYPGETLYELSAHAVSSVTTTIPGEWAEVDAERLIGECQVCHAPMGRDDGTGAPIPTLLEMDASELCLTCHDVDGSATTDLASLAYPATSATDLEIVAGFSPETTTSAFGAVAVWGTEATSTVPRAIVGPRLYAPEGTSGVTAVGDIDGDGTSEVLAADRDFEQLTVFTQDPLKGLSSYTGPGVLVIDEIADHLVIADVIDNGQPEVCIVSGGTLRVYRHDILGVLQLLDTEVGLGTDVTGLAAGDLDGDGFDELVITDAGAPEIHVLTESGGGVAPISYSPIAANAGVRGPSVGDVWATGSMEIAVVNADEASDDVTIYNGTNGAELGSYSIAPATSAQAWGTLIADVLPGVTPSGSSGMELAVAANGGTGMSSVHVYVQLTGGGLDTPQQQYDTGTGYSTGSLAAGDIDGDGFDELVVGNGGYWSRIAAEATAPSIQVFQHNGDQTAFTATPQTLNAGGVERAGSAPSLAVADLGGVGPSRHPVGAVEDAHVSTETAPFTRHVECADCHNVHETTATPVAAPGAGPDAYGRILGTWGATAALADAQPIASEYELCYKCHSAYQNEAGLEGSTDVSADFDAGNTSVHAVEQAVATTINLGTFVDDGAVWDNDSVLYCIDCHSIAGATPPVAGPHTSSEAPILKSPYLGVLPSDVDLLCYDCHEREVYYTGSEDTTSATGSFFWDADAGALHSLHVADQGFGCASCHASHGSVVNESLVRDAIIFARDVDGGSCIGPCHLAPGVEYVR